MTRSATRSPLTLLAALPILALACDGSAPSEGASLVVVLPGAAPARVVAVTFDRPDAVRAIAPVDNGRAAPPSLTAADGLVELRAASAPAPLKAPDGTTLAGDDADSAGVVFGRAVVTADDLAAAQRAGRTVFLSPLTDYIAARLDAYRESVPAERYRALQDFAAAALLRGDLDGDGVVNYLDILAFDPARADHRAAASFSYDAVATGRAAACGCTLAEAYAGADRSAVYAVFDALAPEIRLELPAVDPRAEASLTVVAPNSGGGGVTIDELPAVTVDAASSRFVYRGAPGEHPTLTLRARPDAVDGIGYRLIGWQGCEDARPDGTCVVRPGEPAEIAPIFALPLAAKSAVVKLPTFAPSTEVAALQGDDLTVTVAPGSDADRALEAVREGGHIATGLAARPLARVLAGTPRRLVDADHAAYVFSTADADPSTVYEGSLTAPDGPATIDDITAVTASEPTGAVAVEPVVPAVRAKRAAPVWIVGHGRAFELAPGMFLVGDPATRAPRIALADGPLERLDGAQAAAAAWQSCRANPLAGDCAAFDRIALARPGRGTGPTTPCSLFSKELSCPVSSEISKDFFDGAVKVKLKFELLLDVSMKAGIDFGPGLFVSGYSRGRFTFGVGAQLTASAGFKGGTYATCGDSALPPFDGASAAFDLDVPAAPADVAAVAGLAAKGCEKLIKKSTAAAAKKVITAVDYSVEINRPTPDGALFPIRVGFRAGIEVSGNIAVKITYLAKATSVWDADFAFGKKCRRWGAFDCDDWRFDVGGEGRTNWSHSLGIDAVANAEFTPFAGLYVKTGVRGVKDDLFVIEGRAGVEHALVGRVGGLRYTSFPEDRARGLEGFCWAGNGDVATKIDFVASASINADFNFKKDLGFAELKIGRNFNLFEREFRHPLLAPIVLGKAGFGRTCRPLAEDPAALPATKSWSLGALDWPGAPQIARTKTHELTLQEDGNLVIYKLVRSDSGAIKDYKPIWASNTNGYPGARAKFQSDGNLVVYDLRERPIWSSGTFRNGATRMELDASGVLRIYADGRSLWSSQ